jgi:3-dehydroquinate synthase
MSLTIRSRSCEYQVLLSNAGALNTLFSNEQAIFVVDSKVLDLYREGALRTIPRARTIPVAAKEKSKTLSEIERIYPLMIRAGAKKNALLVAVGGGIIQDIAGFVASTLYRGIKWALVPTTLLAQADSCIGSKTSVNLGRFKNLLGTFYPPFEIHLDTAFLRTLTDLDFRSGLGEIAKLAIIDGEESVTWFERNLTSLLRREQEVVAEAIDRALRIKKGFIEEDEFDQGKRNYLNFGHCFGHAIESATNYHIPHGQAVSIGMILADMVALERGLIGLERFERHRVLSESLVSFDLKKLKLPTAKVLDAIRRDKKRTGKGLTLIMSIGKYEMKKTDDMQPTEVEKALAKLGEIAR